MHPHLEYNHRLFLWYRSGFSGATNTLVTTGSVCRKPQWAVIQITRQRTMIYVPFPLVPLAIFAHRSYYNTVIVHSQERWCCKGPEIPELRKRDVAGRSSRGTLIRQERHGKARVRATASR
jgi:hypothetical protein